MRDSVSAPSPTRSVACAAMLLLALSVLGPAAVAQGGNAGRVEPGADFAQQVLGLINAQRTALGLAAWQLDPALTAIANDHSRALAAQGRLSHDGFAQRFARADRGACVENLAAGQLRPEALVAAWRASPTHLRNLLAPAMHHAGVGQFNGYVALFACD